MLPLSFSTSRQCFTVFTRCFTVKKCYLKKVVFVFCTSAFSQCLQSTNTLMPGPGGLPSSSGGPQRTIMKHLGMSKATLMRVLAFARANPANPIAKRMNGSGHPTKLTEATLEIMKTKQQKTPMLTAIQLRMRIPELEGISVRTIQWACKQTLKMPSRTMRKKPLLTERMRIQRLEFANAYRHWDEDDWKQVMFSDESQGHGGA